MANRSMTLNTEYTDLFFSAIPESSRVEDILRSMKIIANQSEIDKLSKKMIRLANVGLLNYSLSRIEPNYVGILNYIYSNVLAKAWTDTTNFLELWDNKKLRFDYVKPLVVKFVDQYPKMGNKLFLEYYHNQNETTFLPAEDNYLAKVDEKSKKSIRQFTIELTLQLMSEIDLNVKNKAIIIDNFWKRKPNDDFLKGRYCLTEFSDTNSGIVNMLMQYLKKAKPYAEDLYLMTIFEEFVQAVVDLSLNPTNTNKRARFSRIDLFEDSESIRFVDSCVRWYMNRDARCMLRLEAYESYQLIRKVV
ncbi:hypothetical protein H6504_00430 [Candidatus Woesearchaeota archaeon]|nr:hypothetical protein [Candidatus Woesearchaeota archaeon]